MSEFEFFFAFYGLILGLAVAELLQGVAALFRTRELKRLGWQSGLLMAFILLAIVATWLDAWSNLRGVAITMETMAGPFLVAACYYLATAIVMPRNIEDWPSLDAYFAERKRWVMGLLLVAEILLTLMSTDRAVQMFNEQPLAFWAWWLSYNLAIKGCMVGVLLARGRRLNIVLLVGLIVLFAAPYWRMAGFEAPERLSPAAASPPAAAAT